MYCVFFSVQFVFARLSNALTPAVLTIGALLVWETEGAAGALHMINSTQSESRIDELDAERMMETFARI